MLRAPVHDLADDSALEGEDADDALDDGDLLAEAVVFALFISAQRRRGSQAEIASADPT